MIESRRNAIKTFSIIASGLLFGSSFLQAKMLEKDVPHWDEIWDGIVVGSGFAGSSAMLEMLNHGMSKVLMIDKMAYLGGNSSISGGSMAVSVTDMQEKDNIKDNHELHIKDTLVSGHDLNDPEMVKIMAYEGPESFNWLRDNGVSFKWVKRSGGHSVPRSHVSGAGSNIVIPLQKKIKDLGGVIRTRVIMDEIIYNDKDEVVGMKVREKYEFIYDIKVDESTNKTGIVKYYKVNAGIVLATGGFGADLNFRLKFNPNLTADVPMTNHLGATAYTIKKLINDDVDMVDLEYIQLMPVTSADENSFGFGYRMITRGYGYGIMVNPKTGRRFVDEIADRKVKSDAIFAMNENGTNLPILIMDINGTKSVNMMDLQRGIEAGAVFQFETLDELCDRFKINKEPFFDEVKKFNSYVEAGHDPEFGKTFSLYKGKKIKIEDGPFFAARPAPKIHHTMGGVRTTTDCEVYSRKTKDIIGGLYACGELTGGRHGYNRLGSNSVLECVIFGRKAGIAIAKRFRNKLEA